MRAFYSRLATAYGTAIILMFFSEYFFVNEGPVTELLNTVKSNPLLAIPAFISFASFYAFFSYPLLMLLSYFNVRTMSGLLLAGAIFGWATEGLTIAIIYEAIPISFIFPSISWHALIDVMLGWYLVRIGMRKMGLFGNIFMFIMLGLLWGAWATWYWGGEENSMLALNIVDFILLAVVSTGFWLIGMLLADRFGESEFKASKWEFLFILVTYSILFIFIALPYLPFSMLIIPVVALTILAIWRSKDHKKGQKILQRIYSSTPKWWTYIIAVLTPISAILIYSLMLENNIQVPTETIVLTLLAIGFMWFILAIIIPFVTQFKLSRKLPNG
ncbi:MAG: hypothetical protein L3J15_05900 [Devosiaceae bacterium]|nr:hypothetical protein [Devosiaceae bacterium]